MADQCPICSTSLADGRSVVFKDDRLIHAGCWADRPAAPVEAAALGPNDVTQTAGNPDIVALDDFIYGEPNPATSRLATGPGAGGGPHVRMLSGTDGTNVLSLFAYDPAFTGGASVALGDVNGDGVLDLVTGAGPGGRRRRRPRRDPGTHVVQRDSLPNVPGPALTTVPGMRVPAAHVANSGLKGAGPPAYRAVASPP